MMLTFFVTGRHGYKRFEERHLQHAYTEKEIRYLLKKAGFLSVDTYNAMNFDQPAKESE